MRVDGNGDASEGSTLDNLLLLMERKLVSVANVIGTTLEVASDSAGSCDATMVTPTWSSACDYNLFNAISTLAPGAAPRVEFPPLPDVSNHARLHDIKILEPDVRVPLHVASRARRRNYNHNWHFQDRWAALVPWAEAIVGGDGRVSQARCKVCSHMEGWKKLLVPILPKIDSLWKHARRCKALTTFGRVKKGEFYFLSTNQHVKNEHVFFACHTTSVVQ